MDLRYCGLGRPTMRDPKHPHWPQAGERTHLEVVARRWRKAYTELADSQHLARTIGRRPQATLSASVESYLAHRARLVEPRTYAGDQTALNRLLEAFPGQTPVDALNLQRLVDHLLDEGYQPTTVKQYVTVNIQGLWRWLDLPFPKVQLPKPAKADVKYWTPGQVERLRKLAPSVHPDMLRALDMTLFMGLRVGEVFALRWEDVEGDTVRVQRQIPQGRTTPKPLKGKKSRTAFVLPGWTHEGTEGLIVHRGGAVVGRKVLEKWMTKLLDSAKLNRKGAGWHQGRHTYARTCLDMGFSLEQLQHFLGHSSIRTTEESYGHFRTPVAIERARATIRRDVPLLVAPDRQEASI